MDLPKITKGKPQGVTYVASIQGEVFELPEIDATILKNYTVNKYAVESSNKMRNLIFADGYEIKAYDDKGEENEELTERLSMMAEQTGLYYNMQAVYSHDIFFFGMGFESLGWSKEGNEYVLNEIRRLPAETFATAPTGNFEQNGVILEGVALTKDGKVEYYQQQGTDGEPVKIDNIFTISNPQHDAIDGQAEILPLAPYLGMLEFSWKAQMQKVNRIGAPPLFIKLNNPTKKDTDHAKMILRNWGKDTGFGLKSNMELVKFDGSDNMTAQDTIELLEKNIDKHFSPSSYLGEDGALISNGDSSKERVFETMINGTRLWLTDQFERIFDYYFEVNGFEGYHCEINIIENTKDDMELNVKVAEMGYKTKALTTNEIRAKLGLPELEDAELAELVKFYEENPPTTTSLQNVEQKVEEGQQANDRLQEALDKLLQKTIEKL